MNVRHTPKQTVVSSSDTTVRLTKRQVWGLGRVKEDYPISPDLFQQLQKKDLVSYFGKYQRLEWNSPVATLASCILTPFGKQVFQAIEEDRQA